MDESYQETGENLPLIDYKKYIVETNAKFQNLELSPLAKRIKELIHRLDLEMYPYDYDEMCPNCDKNTLVQIAGPEHQSLVKRTQLWECSECGYTEER